MHLYSFQTSYDSVTFETIRITWVVILLRKYFFVICGNIFLILVYSVPNKAFKAVAITFRSLLMIIIFAWPLKCHFHFAIKYNKQSKKPNILCRKLIINFEQRLLIPKFHVKYDQQFLIYRIYEVQFIVIQTYFMKQDDGAARQ